MTLSIIIHLRLIIVIPHKIIDLKHSLSRLRIIRRFLKNLHSNQKVKIFSNKKIELFCFNKIFTRYYDDVCILLKNGKFTPEYRTTEWSPEMRRLQKEF